ncbi:MAG: exo-alpha-sialidase [Phycisphaerae bacterium]
MHQSSARTAMFLSLAVATVVAGQRGAMAETKTIQVEAANFSLGANSSTTDGSDNLKFVIDPAPSVPFVQSAVKQDPAPASLGPNPKIPYFTVRFAMPIPPENATSEVAALTGIDPMVYTHNHSPGFEILPNGDALAIYFSTPPGKAEADPSTSFVQARLRYGSEEWDMPELFFKTKGYNDQSGLLWNDHGKIWFFGGGRKISDMVPFRMATSTDNGMTWTFSIPQLDKPATSYEAQPITSAFRGADGNIYFGMDGHAAHSFLWRSTDDGIHWHDMGGRTDARHSTFVPLDNTGKILYIGGKNNNVEHWNPEGTSDDYGATWSKPIASHFPVLSSGQRPSLIRLASGNLLYVTDSYLHKLKRPAEEGWKYGDKCVVALSTDNGASWHIKPLPVQVGGHQRPEHPTVGYTVARQSPNGVIHILTTVTQPCLDYELNEAWILSDAGDDSPENSGGKIQSFSEKYPDGKPRSTWSARICPNGRYLLNGEELDYYPDGQKEHQVTYADGRKTGEESFWSPDGKIAWKWEHNLADNRAVWTHYWPNGNKKSESSWNTLPVAPGVDRHFVGYVADGPAIEWDESGKQIGSHQFTNGIIADDHK